MPAAGGTPLVLSPVGPRAFNAAVSSTDDAAALASTPAAFSFSSNSLLDKPCSFAISCTRFLVIDLSILGAWGRSSLRNAMLGQDRRVVWRGQHSRRKACRVQRRDRDR